MNKDINAITVLLATQGMINIGAVPDPITRETRSKPEKAMVFLQLLEVLREKTRGNLTRDEEEFLNSAIENMGLVLHHREKNGEEE